MLQYGEIDCWQMECPPLTCSNPVTEDGDCCPRCEDDPCRRVLPGNDTSLEDVTRARPCSYSGIIYDSGSSWQDPHDKCTTCECKVRRTPGSNHWLTEESSVSEDTIEVFTGKESCESSCLQELSRISNIISFLGFLFFILIVYILMYSNFLYN